MFLSNLGVIYSEEQYILSDMYIFLLSKFKDIAGFNSLFLIDDYAKALHVHDTKKVMLLIYSNQSLTFYHFILIDLTIDYDINI